jgi:hypothetical protein
MPADSPAGRLRLCGLGDGQELPALGWAHPRPRAVVEHTPGRLHGEADIRRVGFRDPRTISWPVAGL